MQTSPTETTLASSRFARVLAFTVAALATACDGHNVVGEVGGAGGAHSDGGGNGGSSQGGSGGTSAGNGGTGQGGTSNGADAALDGAGSAGAPLGGGAGMDAIAPNDAGFHGDGGFQTFAMIAGINYPAGLRPVGVAIGDLNGDGKPDLAVADTGPTGPNPQGGGGASLLFNDGSGGFGAPVHVGTQSLSSIAIGDVDGDGKLDLVGMSPAGVGVFKNDGTGVFPANPMNYAFPTGEDRSNAMVALADVDHDGHVDIVQLFQFAGGAGAVVLLNNGDGTFRPALVAPAAQTDAGLGATDARGMALGDLDGDGRPELIIPFGSGAFRGIDVFGNRGGGTFKLGATYASDWFPLSVAVADVNGDGKLDVLAATATVQGAMPSPGGVIVLLNRGDGTLADPVPYDVPGSTIAVGDVDGDGKPDIATTDATGLVQILINQGNGTFSRSSPSVAGGGITLLSMAMADLNGDGAADIVTTNTFAQESDARPGWVTVLSRNTVPAEAAPLLQGNATTGVAIGDLNGDGMMDIAAAVPSTPPLLNPKMRVWTNAGNRLVIPADYALDLDPKSIQLADLDGDGKLDVALTTTTGAMLMLNSGTGTFGAPIDYMAGANVAGMALGDWNGDGRTDMALATTTPFDGNVIVLMNPGKPIFSGQGVSYRGGIIPSFIASGDFNGDGKSDLVVADTNGYTANVLLNRGDGTFADAVSYPVGASPQWIAVKDWNGDGKPDLVVANFGDNDVSLLLNKGDGTFAPAVNTAVLGGLFALTAADVTGDGLPDLITSSSAGLGVLPNLGNATFGKLTSFAAGAGVSMAACGDMDGDGKIDVIVGDGAGLAVLMNASH